jgi:prolyl-tRNA editing enzyme YbaK/EbsC (Cys-tRNA(Pro) deacylase)
MVTNAVRPLEERGVRHQLRAYGADPDELTAEAGADKLGLPPEQVSKTVVAQRPPGGLLRSVAGGLPARP